MKVKIFTLSFILTFLLSACGASSTASPTLDIYAIYTAAAETVIAEFTKTAAVSPPTQAVVSTATQGISTATLVPTSIQTATPTLTSTPAPTATILATPTDMSCDNYIFITDVSIQDKTEMSPGQNFEKTWEIRNTGTCTWGEGYHLVFGYGDEMSGQPRELSVIVSPEESVEVVVIFAAPYKAGEYKSYWRMANISGANFGHFFSAIIVVR